MRLPESLTDKQFCSKVFQGTILKTEIEFQNKNKKIKRIICLNKSINEDLLYFVVSTSQIRHLHKNYQFQDNCYLLKPDESKFFEKETIIDLRQVYQQQINIFLRKFNEANLEILGNLEEPILNKILVKIKQSQLIEKRVKKNIL